MKPEIQLGKNGCYFVKIGMMKRYDGLGLYFLNLASDEAVSKDRAERLWQLWLTQGDMWAKEGREIAKGWDKLEFPF
jgi:hypothetical protein